jgi:hypothetical protein
MSPAAAAASFAPRRETLKARFRNGMVPDEDSFAELIDALALRTEVAQLRADLQAQQQQPARRDIPEPLVVAGRFDPAAPGAARPFGAEGVLAGCRMPADGHWHRIIGNLDGCYAFEIVAAATGMVGADAHAVTHAIALSQLGRQGAVRQTPSGWPRPWWRRLLDLLPWRRPAQLQLRWVEEGDTLMLAMRSTISFGFDQQQQPVQINYHITRLW